MSVSAKNKPQHTSSMSSEPSFQDFTTATNWERFAANIETHLLRWITAPQTALSQVKLEQPLTADGYSFQLTCFRASNPPSTTHRINLAVHDHASAILYHEPAPARAHTTMPWWCCRPADRLTDASHKLQQWFGVDCAAIVEPCNYTQRIQRATVCPWTGQKMSIGILCNSQEATLVLSAAAVALHAVRQAAPSCTLAVFVPVQSSIQDAYHGASSTFVINAPFFQFDDV